MQYTYNDISDIYVHFRQFLHIKEQITEELNMSSVKEVERSIVLFIYLN